MSTSPRLAITTEEWRPVVGYEGFYAVSSYGRVKRVHQQHGTHAGRVLKGHNLSNKGYYHVYLCVGNKRRRRLVHRLVAQAFLGVSSLEINHIDGNGLNNRLDNLEYATRQENAAHARVNGFYARGERTGAVALTRRKVRHIRTLKGKMTYDAIARRYGVTYSCIQGVMCGRTWAWLS